MMCDGSTPYPCAGETPNNTQLAADLDKLGVCRLVCHLFLGEGGLLLTADVEAHTSAQDASTPAMLMWECGRTIIAVMR
jgi:hypothetical protein